MASTIHIRQQAEIGLRPSGLPPQWGVPRTQRSLNTVLQRPREVDFKPAAAALPGLDASHTVLLQNLRNAVDVGRLPLSVVQAVQRILDIVDERHRYGDIDRTPDKQVLDAVLVELHRVLAALSPQGSPKGQHRTPRADLSRGSMSSVVLSTGCNTEDSYLQGDPWEGCEELATADLFDFFVESLQVGSSGSDVSPRESTLPVPQAMLLRHVEPADEYHQVWSVPQWQVSPRISPRCRSCGSQCQCHCQLKPSPRCCNIGSTSTLASLNMGSSERLSTVSTLCSSQPSASSRTSTVSSARTTPESWEGEQCTGYLSGRGGDAAVQHGRLATTIPTLLSAWDPNTMRPQWERRFDTAHGRPSGSATARESTASDGKSWQKMWQSKLLTARRSHEQEQEFRRLVQSARTLTDAH